MNPKRHPDQATLRLLLDYDPETGKLWWKRRDASLFRDGKHSKEHNANTWNSRYAGKEAFASKNGNGYFQGSIFKRKYEIQRVIWAWMTGEWPPTVDHENGNIEDNRWRNLQAKSRSGNQRNLGLRRNNTTGINGVCKIREDRWRATIMIDRKCITLGHFKTKQEAEICRLAANEKYGFHKNHGARKSTAARTRRQKHISKQAQQNGRLL